MIKVKTCMSVLPSVKVTRDEELFKQQMEVRSAFMLLGDTNTPNKAVSINTKPHLKLESNFKWVNKGEVIAGSWVTSHIFGADIAPSDIDIYFKCREDAERFCKLNKLSASFTTPIAFNIDGFGIRINAIFGVHYESPEDLIYHFDIRACSTAYDPNSGMAYMVPNALDDARHKLIVYNPMPHNTSIARLVKYVDKGFIIEAYQRVFLLELIKSGAIDPTIELTSGYRAVEKV